MTASIATQGVQAAARWWWCGIAMIALLCGGAQRSAAQRSLTDSVETPDTLVLSDRAPTATFTLYNRSATPIEGSLAPECEGGDYARSNAGGGWQRDAVVMDPLTAAWHNAGACAAVWLTGYPRFVRLAPHERRTITVRIIPPATLPNGRYTVRLISGGEYGHFRHHDVVDITYLRGPWPRLHWRPTPPTGPGSAVVEATPTAVVLGYTARPATFMLHNRAARPTEVWLSIDCPWFLANIASYPQSSQYEQAWHNRIPDAALGLSGLPQHLVLAPHERRTLRLQLTAQPFMIPNVSYARVVVAEAPVVLVSPGGESTYTTPSSAVIVAVSAAKPELILTPPYLRDYSPGDTFREVCNTLRRQDALGFLATLHIEMDDAQGRPVQDMRPPLDTSEYRVAGLLVPGPHIAGRRGQATSTVWAIDTTLAVWQVVHNPALNFEILNDGKDGLQPDGNPKSPEPFCVLLPHVPPGQYHLVISADAVEDVEHHQPIQATLPVAIP